MVRITGTLVAGLLLTAAPVGASTLIGENFFRTSTGEHLVAPFDLVGGAATTQVYGGYVEVIISGVGYAFGENTNDAFYGVEGADERFPGEGVPLEDSPMYQLSIGWNGAPLQAYDYSGERSMINYISFVDGLGPVAAPHRPAYEPSHIYHFVIQVPQLAGQLAFGVADGDYEDNGGAYLVSVWSVTPVPLPASLWLLGGAVGILTVLRRRPLIAPRACS